MSSEAADGARDRILDAAQQVFAARGFRGGSLNEVASLAGYTRAGLLHYFPSKTDLLLGLLERRDARLQVGVPIPGPDSSIFTQIELAKRAQEAILEDRETVQLAHILTAEVSGGDHPAGPWVAERHRRLREAIATGVAHSISGGELPGWVDPLAMATMMLGLAEGLEAQWLVDPTVDPPRVFDLLERLLRALPHG